MTLNDLLRIIVALPDEERNKEVLIALNADQYTLEELQFIGFADRLILEPIKKNTDVNFWYGEVSLN